MILITQGSIVVAGVLLGVALIQYLATKGARECQQYILDCAVYTMEQDKKLRLKQQAQKEEADRIQRTKMFYMDLLISHGSAFGGFCSTMDDGRRKKGMVELDQIMLYGRHPSGKEFTYYIEDQNIEIGATDDPEILFIRSNDGSRFEIRRSGHGRDEGESAEFFLLRKDVRYYVILESKHEITVKAVKGC